MLLMEKLQILRQPLGQRILRYASLDDITIWGVLALILLDWQRVGRQAGFLLLFGVVAVFMRKLMRAIPERDRWYVGLIWLATCGFGADWAGLHFMVGAFLSGAVLDSDMVRSETDGPVPPSRPARGDAGLLPADGAAHRLERRRIRRLRARRRCCLWPPVSGKLAGVHIAGKVLKWEKGEASIIGWLLQTKALIMIIFVNILLDRNIISSEAFTATLLMAVGSTMLTVPIVSPKLHRIRDLVFKVSNADSEAAEAPPTDKLREARG